ncbi:PREDICTED: uncharacterized protein LOC108764350 [Trachymyrmex cornetzi]|uniref:uncharacterized protein LOC108764350 n=1 Tax=Trachymyrmex cornetzi TaxID=471704 RepID=UPI00084F2903|nr:PREDICTED: uncharacterized protein LOC108764350 [Trachymyrmex cornetzi]
MEFMKTIEYNLKKLQSSVHNSVRNHSLTIINNLLSFKTKNTLIYDRLNRLMNHTRHFIKENNNIIFTKADKGNITVALEKTSYIEKIRSILSDEETYLKITKNPSSKINNGLRTLLTRWKKSKFISDLTYKKLYCSDGNLPRAYGSPKVHKPDCPFRIIVSAVDSTLYDLAAFLHRLIVESVPEAPSHVNNSYDLIEKLKSIKIKSGYSLVSLDVVSLFTNVPIDLVMEALSNRWRYIEKKCKITKEEFLKAVHLILDSTYFTFDDQTYKQTFGTPMGSPLSPIIADLVMQDLESRVLSTIKFPLLFYYRYVDDIVLCVPTSEVEDILNRFNSFHPRLQFTIEVGGSQHPISQKKGTIFSLID